MKTLTTGMAVFLLLLTSACQSPEQTADDEDNPLQGTWKIVYSWVSTPDTTIEREPTSPAIKVVNATHYAIGRQAGEDSVWASGGRYNYDGTTYKEFIQYHSYGDIVGDTITLNLRLEGDTTWYKSYTSDTLEWKETWRRIEW